MLQVCGLFGVGVGVGVGLEIGVGVELGVATGAPEADPLGVGL